MLRNLFQLVPFLLLVYVTSAVAFDETDLKKFKALNACEGCDLSGAYLNYADLREANLSGAALTTTTLKDAKLDGAAVGMHPVTAHGFNLGLRGQNKLAKNVRSAQDRNIDIGSPEVLEDYQSTHRRITWPLYLGTNALVKLYTTDGLQAKIVRTAMLRLWNNLWPIKRTLMRKLTKTTSLPIL